MYKGEYKMIENKFKVGSQWKTRGGWKAIILDIKKDSGKEPYLKVLHYVNEFIIAHNIDGTVDESDKYDLIEPWKEHRKGEFWVNVYDDKHCGIVTIPHETKHSADSANYKKSRIACVKVEWTEGEGLEDE